YLAEMGKALMDDVHATLSA
ncbi:DUF3077 domain-containing protein, partial [Pseudomonas protegens]|nr:DUF3077 domain-containing protein [Pseudomonas protegens]